MARGKKNGAAKRGGRKSRAESMTGKKEGSVDVRMGGDNAPELKLPAPDDFLHHMKTIRGAIEKKDTAVSLVRHAKQAAEKAVKGLSGTIDKLIKLERSNDPHAFQREMELLGFGLKVTNSPVQLTVFDTLLGDVKEQAYKRGVDDGENGRTATDRYPEGSELSSEYQRGWQHGTAKNLGLTPEQSDEALADDDQKAWPDDTQAQASGAAHA